MLSNRKNIILKIIIEEYIKTAEPVGSVTLAKLEELNCSSATIRNEMAELESLGYLEKTHTSSGRVPSEEGYRYYVESLLTFDEQEYFDEIDLEEIFTNTSQSYEEIIEDTISLISEMTNYTSIVLGPKAKSTRIKRIDVVKLSNVEILILIITESGYIENKKLSVEEQDIEKVIKIVEVLNKVLFNCLLDEAKEKLNSELETNDLLNYIDFKDKLLELFLKVFESFAREKYYVKGKFNLLNEPEFSDIESVRSLVEAVESDKLLKLIDATSQGLSVTIGSQNNVEFMENCTLISIPYYTKEGFSGKIAVVGPKRMNYKKVIPLLNYIAKNMNKLN